MCDYSLYEFPNRLAQEREALVVYRFPSGAIGLASAHDVCNVKPEFRDSKAGIWAGLKEFFLPRRHYGSVCAVCVPPGARLQLNDIPAAAQRIWGLAAQETAVFMEMSANVHTYRDAVQFRNGRQVRLQDLSEGQRVQVLSLACSEEVSVEKLSQEAEKSPLCRSEEPVSLVRS